mmetsp:Transcript_97351/g.209907  ORF Transcript_97351/g.209907 Transcript_97351/m.209907 type:complete len:264 (-) Transcript_97351:1177-1968(-)
MEIANMNPELRLPISRPARQRAVSRKPTPRGTKMAMTPGMIISRMEALVAICTHTVASALTPSGRGLSTSLSSGYFLNCLRISMIMASAARPTESMVNAANTNGRQAPISTPTMKIGSVINTSTPSKAWFMNAVIRPIEVRTALPMANPLPVAAVVLPRESRASVRSLISSSHSSSISAIPPALSATGPYASVAKVMPRVLSMPTAAIATEYKPSNVKQIMTVTTTMKQGNAVPIMPMPSPWMMTGAGPVLDFKAMLWVGHSV